jgi:bacteriocin biosynthesis cyclodehydratase domain-containing protein
LIEGRSGNIRLIDKKLESLSEVLEEQAHAHDLLITVMRNGPESIYRQINRFVLKTGITWLRVEDAPDAIEVGPLVNPGDSGCHACMILRKRSSDEYAIEEQLYQSHLDIRSDDTALLHGELLPTATLAASLAVTEVFNFASKVNPTTLEDSVTRVFFDGKIERHKFSRVPRCPECYQGEVLTVYQSGLLE